jgi:hypothetical protein
VDHGQERGWDSGRPPARTHSIRGVRANTRPAADDSMALGPAHTVAEGFVAELRSDSNPENREGGDRYDLERRASDSRTLGFTRQVWRSATATP